MCDKSPQKVTMLLTNKEISHRFCSVSQTKQIYRKSRSSLALLTDGGSGPPWESWTDQHSVSGDYLLLSDDLWLKKEIQSNPTLEW